MMRATTHGNQLRTVQTVRTKLTSTLLVSEQALVLTSKSDLQTPDCSCVAPSDTVLAMHKHSVVCTVSTFVKRPPCHEGSFAKKASATLNDTDPGAGDC